MTQTGIRLGRHYQIGGGSVIAPFGQTAFDEALLGSTYVLHDGRQIYFIAEFRCKGDEAQRARVPRMQQQSVLTTLMTDKSFGLKPDYERFALVARPFCKKGWPRVIIRVCVNTDVRDLEKFCRSLTQKLARCWPPIQHSEFDWGQTNEDVVGVYPIRPDDIRGNCDAVFGEKNLVDAARVALAGSRGGKNLWGKAHVYSSTPFETAAGLHKLAQMGFLTPIGQYDFRIRERLIVALFRSSLGETGH